MYEVIDERARFGNDALVLALAISALVVAAPPHRLKWDPRIDLPVTGALVGGWVLSEFAFKGPLAPDACRWCATNGLDVAVRRAFNPSLMPSADGLRGPALASDLIGFIALPSVLLALDGLGARESPDFWKTWAVDTLIMLEATFAALAVNQVVKFSVGRARPYTVDAPAELLATGKDPNDHSLAFFSGHTTFSIGATVSAGVIGLLRGYRLAWLTWAIGVPIALTTATLRMAADKHWLTDILVGSLVGSAFGVAIPALFHGREPLPFVTVRVSPTSNGVALTGSFQ